MEVVYIQNISAQSCEESANVGRTYRQYGLSQRGESHGIHGEKIVVLLACHGVWV